MDRRNYPFLKIDLTGLVASDALKEIDKADGKFVSEWTFWLPREQFIEALKKGLPSEYRWDQTIDKQLGFDGEAEFVFGHDRSGKGRFHAVCCFGGQYYSITFRSMKGPKQAAPEARAAAGA